MARRAGRGTTSEPALNAKLQHWHVPADQVEAAVGWKLAIERQHGPTALILLSRQNLAQVERTPEQVKAIARGGYMVFLKDSGGKPDIILDRYRIENGNSHPPCGGKGKNSDWRGHNVRVVSLPSTILFRRRTRHYRESVLPAHVTACVAVEAGIAGLLV